MQVGIFKGYLLSVNVLSQQILRVETQYEVCPLIFLLFGDGEAQVRMNGRIRRESVCGASFLIWRSTCSCCAFCGSRNEVSKVTECALIGDENGWTQVLAPPLGDIHGMPTGTACRDQDMCESR